MVMDNRFVRKRIAPIIAVCIVTLVIAGCGGNSSLKSFTDECGVDLSKGRIVSEEDNHGGFHGDGFSLLVADYSQNTTVADEILASENWHQLPLPENLATFVYQPYDEDLQIPQIENGCYYFYDRHDEATDPYDDTELLSRYSFNFTLAIFDTDTSTLYLCRYDT
ncbi:MAG: hypothetical protein IJT40_03770 [Firmicutes bacterium]|nr:hypothetical protein [Bacillota bacterium]